MSNYDSKDLTWDWTGDFVLGNQGDLGDNSEDELLSVEQEIITIVKSSKGDWIFHPEIGANLWKFLGEPNTRENAEKIKKTITRELVFAGIVAEQDIIIDVNAISLDSVYIKIFLKATPTLKNRLKEISNNFASNKEYGRGIEVKFFFNTSTSAITF
jgi:hypothetical protein